MANNVFANGRELSCKSGSGKSICAFPDVCFTPPENPATPPGVPVPYPNTGMTSDTTSGSKTVKISGKEVMLKNKSYFKKSMGDEAGCAAKKGVLTSVNRGKVYFTAWSMDVKFEGQNVVRHFDLTTHNHMSIPGNTPPWPYTDSMSPPPPPEQQKCPPHEWEEESRQSPDETKAHNEAEAAHLKSKPSKAHQATGPEFENEAIDANMDKLAIEATTVIYRCRICNAEQEVDILGKEKVAEAKSRTKKGWKNASRQHKNYGEIQQQVFGGGKPLAKADGDKLSDEDKAWFDNKLKDRGFETEIL